MKRITNTLNARGFGHESRVALLILLTEDLRLLHQGLSILNRLK
jgi:hypothetical protein